MVETPCSVGDDQRIHAQRPHHSDGKRGLLEPVAFIGMEATLHDQDLDAAGRREHELPTVSRDAWSKKARDLRKRDAVGIL